MGKKVITVQQTAVTDLLTAVTDFNAHVCLQALECANSLLQSNTYDDISI